MLSAWKFWLLPPGANLLLLGLALLLVGLKWRRSGWLLCALATLSLLWLALPSGAWTLHRFLHIHPVPTVESAAQAQAIVVLGGGRLHAAPEWDGLDTISNPTLRRLHEGVRWQRQLGLPLVLSGGLGTADQAPEAELMARNLRQVYDLDQLLLEPDSRNTWENARFTAALLQQHDLSPVLLVTQAHHMPRAVYAFEQAGVAVIPAPVEHLSVPSAGRLTNWVPRAYYLHQSSQALHEWLGLVAYRWRGNN
ncbi:YdcF family protein [Natronospirillum operosum]|uniref:YdcF family protein n=1 Tax=Natronospirillum operosum TaxID=2759953 RepID=A0A4Z0WEB7_9GAMM|nr:YdcF family protein [Natronospirillum operosum]TGG92493.1 YdcF family protein [Natronospirillum operosum]